MTMVISRLAVLTAIVASVLISGTSSALASLSDEVGAGHAVAARLDSGTAGCTNLSTADFEHLGEYVMERMVGSRSVHAAMNARMDEVIGSANADRMHQALGRRYAACAATGVGSGMTGGTGMMSGSGGWDAMTSSRYAWMRNGTWQQMTRAGWRRAGSYMMGDGWMIHGGGWNTVAVIAVALAALVLGGLATYTMMRRPWRGGRSHPSTA